MYKNVLNHVPYYIIGPYCYLVFQIGKYPNYNSIVFASYNHVLNCTSINNYPYPSKDSYIF